MLRIRIRYPGAGALIPGSGMGKKSGSKSEMNNPDHVSESLETIFFGLKFLNSLMRIRDGKNMEPGSGMQKFGSGIRDEQPPSYFRELRNHFFRLKYLNSLMRIWDPGWKKFGSGIRVAKNSVQDLG